MPRVPSKLHGGIDVSGQVAATFGTKDSRWPWCPHSAVAKLSMCVYLAKKDALWETRMELDLALPFGDFEEA